MSKDADKKNREITQGIVDYQEDALCKTSDLEKPPLKPLRQYVLDTNVLMHDPYSLFAFQEHVVVIPFDVLAELDHHKTRDDEVGRSSREVIRLIDSLVGQGTTAKEYSYQDRVSWFIATKINSSGGVLKIGNYDFKTMPMSSLDFKVPDDRIIASALLEKEIAELWSSRHSNPRVEWVADDAYLGVRVCFVSKDICDRLKAIASGIVAEDYKHTKIDFDELYTGKHYLPESLTITDSSLSGFKKMLANGTLTSDDLEKRKILTPENSLVHNQFVVFSHKKTAHEKLADNNVRCSSIGRFVNDFDGDVLQRLRFAAAAPKGVRPINYEQVMALELLLDPEVRVVTLVGRAGTGKTLLSIAAGWDQVERRKIYEKILVSRPIIPVGNDIGYLPGDKDEKLANWMQPIYDNIEYILRKEERRKKEQRMNSENKKPEGKKNDFSKKQELPITSQYVQMFVKSNPIFELEAMTYIRGRSLSHCFILIDEAQNLTPHEVKTIISRVGEGSKIVLCGDPYQIDRPFIDASSNGLTYTVERFKGQACYGHVTLDITERSEIAALAHKLL